MTKNEALFIAKEVTQDWAVLCGCRVAKVEWETCRNTHYYTDDKDEKPTIIDQEMLIVHVVNQSRTVTWNIAVLKTEVDEFIPGTFIAFLRRRWSAEMEGIMVHAARGLEAYQTK